MKLNHDYEKSKELIQKDIIQAFKRYSQLESEQLYLQQEIDKKINEKREIQIFIDSYKSKMRRIKKKKDKIKNKIRYKRNLKREICRYIN